MTSQTEPPDLDRLIETLVDASPGGPAEDRRTAARAALEALQPRDIVEAMLAVRMIAAHHASMDGFRRAMQPDVSNADAVRLRNNAVAAGRSSDAALRALEKRQSPVSSARAQTSTGAPSHPQQPAAQTAPAHDAQPLPEAVLGFPSEPQFVPRDKSGNPIPDWRWEDMTMAQRRATYGDPADPEVQAIIAAEEEAYRQAGLGG